MRLGKIESVYLSGPYSSSSVEGVELNVDRTIEYANMLIDYGYDVFWPHSSHYLHARKERHYEDWMDMDLRWVTRCDAMFRIPGPSAGADREVRKARRSFIPVFTNTFDLLLWNNESLLWRITYLLQQRWFGT